MLFATLIGDPRGHYLMASMNGAVQVVDRPGVTTQSIAKSLDPHRASSYEGSMSRVLHSMAFNPTEVMIPDDLEKLKNEVLLLEEGKPVLMRLSSLSGGYFGYKVRPEVAAKMLGKEDTPKEVNPSK